MASVLRLPLPSPQFGEDAAAPSFSIKPGTFGYVPKTTAAVPWYSKSQDDQSLKGISHVRNTPGSTFSAAGKAAFFCDACDRGFNSVEQFNEHTAGHEKCSVKGCPYVAAPKLVEMHYKMQHRTGLAEKIWKADIAKWQAERRRNYPTAANIARKESERQARIARGEVLETKSFGKMRQKNRYGTHKRSYQEADLQHKSSMDESTPATAAITQQPAVHVLGSALAAVPAAQQPAPSKEHEGHDPLSLLLTTAGGSIHPKEGDRDRASANAPGSVAIGELPSGLLALAVQYAGSDTEEEGEIRDDDGDDIVNTTTLPVTAASCRPVPDVHKLPPKAKAKPSCSGRKPTRRKPTLLEQQDADPEHTPRSISTFDESATIGSLINIPARSVRGSSSSSLQPKTGKLLAPEIRKERNAILQCIRYVVNNGFLQPQDRKPVATISAPAPPADYVADVETWD